MSTPDNVKQIELFAWLGEDEFGSGEVGIKQARVPAGMVPLVASKDDKMSQDYIVNGLQQQANKYGKTIRLCKFIFVEEIITLEPK